MTASIKSAGSKRGASAPLVASLASDQTALMPAEPLTETEEKELQELETIVHQEWAVFLQVGKALVQIRDKRLYRGKAPSFIRYCQEIFGYQRSHLNRFTEAADTFALLAPLDRGAEPISERKLRPLTRLSSNNVKTAWSEILKTAGDGAISARLIAEVAQKYPSKSGRARKTKKPAAASDSTLRQAFDLIAKIEDGFRFDCEKDEWPEWVAELKTCVKALASRKT